jgi:integrase
MRKVNRLSARAVATLKKPGRHADGGGLYLTVDKSGSKRWTFMFEQAGRQREAGLGGVNSVPLAKAREIAAEFREAIAAGRDPIAERQADRQAQRARKTFWECAVDLHESKRSGWRNAKHAAQWLATLDQHAKSLRDVPVDLVDTTAVLGALQPIWRTVPETATRVRGRIETVLDAAKALGLRSGENPARWRGHLALILPKPTKAPCHHAAMPYGDVPAFLTCLRTRQSVAARALEFLILTAARSGEVLGAKWSEIDADNGVWTIPASRMKAGREHRVPLSSRAAAILAELAEGKTGEFIFPGQQAGKHLSSLEMVMTRMDVDATVHGFRSAFCDWASEATSFPREITEQCLAHLIGSNTERAYRRGDVVEKRRFVLQAWADFCDLSLPSNVVSIAVGH